MEVILLNKVTNLGHLGDKVKVKNGFARNFLIPTGQAKPATPENIKEFEVRRSELEKNVQAELAKSNVRKEQIDTIGSISIKAKVGSEGKLFGSIGTLDIVEAAKAAGLDLEKREVRLPEGNLRAIGEYEIVLHLNTDVETTLKVTIEPEE